MVARNHLPFECSDRPFQSPREDCMQSPGSVSDWAKRYDTARPERPVPFTPLKDVLMELVVGMYFPSRCVYVASVIAITPFREALALRRLRAVISHASQQTAKHLGRTLDAIGNLEILCATEHVWLQLRSGSRHSSATTIEMHVDACWCVRTYLSYLRCTCRDCEL